MKRKRLSAYRRAQKGIDYKPPPPSETEQRGKLFSHGFRLARMILLHKIFDGKG